ncbi:MAG: FxsA family protein [Gemmatimonadota bacterium]|uniref:FxsA family protein n=1 Tax=Candidatus Palauibacter scopulicola TaxID=3056741 RepID=UPI00238B35BF|nr:FxsA family protein [Candidatus Palauibacter scopulicola]MDE2661847.1 FxsA family protein [Candidatus Palauibacter scopulicola]
MLLRLFLLFTIVPVVELALLIRIGGLLGLGPTLLLVMGTGFAGAWLARREGLRGWLAVRDELQGGALPGESLVHALLILVAGIVLITPGVITDIAGILLLIPPVRRRLIARVRDRLSAQIERGTIQVMSGSGGGFSGLYGNFGARPGTGGAGRGRGPRSSRREIIIEESEPDGD